MSVIRCIHPTCNRPVTRGRSMCGLHFACLDDDLRRSLLAAKSRERIDDVHAEIISYYQSRFIGDNELTPCRHCGNDVVWIDGRYGRLPIEADGLEESDTTYDPKRHTKHNCREYRESLNDRVVA